VQSISGGKANCLDEAFFDEGVQSLRVKVLSDKGFDFVYRNRLFSDRFQNFGFCFAEFACSVA